MGKNTQILVSVEASSEPATSRVPLRQLSNTLSPASRRFVMLSSTTILLSTSIPIPTASPPSDTRLSEMFIAHKPISATNTDKGIVMETTSDERILPTNK